MERLENRPGFGLWINFPYQRWFLSIADNLCKQFGPRSGPTKCWSWSGSNLFDTLIGFPKDFFFKVYFEKSQQTSKIMKYYPAWKELRQWEERLIKRLKTINCMLLSYSVNAIIWQTVYGDIGSTEIVVSDKVLQVNQETHAYISRTFWGNWSNQIWPNKCTCSFKYIWASTRENLF